MSRPSKPASVMELAILGLLMDDDLHGYELKKRLAELPGAGINVSFGSLYPALARLERAGSVSAVRQSGAVSPASPMTGALSGELAAFRSRGRTTEPTRERGRRGKKVYRITVPGRVRLTELLLDDTDDDRAFNLRVAFASHLEPEQRRTMLSTRREQLAERLRELSARPTPSKSDPFLLSLEEHDMASLNRDITWLDALLDSTIDDNEQGDVLNPTTTGGT